MKKSRSKIIFDIFNYTIMGLLVLTILYPFINQIAISLSSNEGILKYDITLLPVDFTFETYTKMLKDNTFWIQYKNTILITAIGTSIGLLLTLMASYALAKQSLYGRSVILKMILFTMFFSGGLIPNFALMRGLGLIDTWTAVILPSLMIPYNILITRTYLAGLPQELEEAGRIDGLGQFGHFIKIVLPLSKPIIATMTLFIAVVYWNDWFSALIYLNDTSSQPVTLYLRNALMGATLSAQTGTVDSTTITVPDATRAASLILVIFPIICIYPFVQKYFVQGVMIGSVKG